MSFLNILFSPTQKSSSILERKLDLDKGEMTPQEMVAERDSINKQLSELSNKMMFHPSENTEENHQIIDNLNHDKELLEERLNQQKAA